ncbi:MAG: hypothetical protein R3B49_08040 [Phycisphaerales bacterium]
MKEGDTVKSTGRLLEVPVGESLLGRGEPAGRGARRPAAAQRAQSSKVDIIAPGIAERQPVHEPLQTGIKAIDSDDPDWSRAA